MLASSSILLWQTRRLPIVFTMLLAPNGIEAGMSRAFIEGNSRSRMQWCYPASTAPHS